MKSMYQKQKFKPEILSIDVDPWSFPLAIPRYNIQIHYTDGSYRSVQMDALTLRENYFTYIQDPAIRNSLLRTQDIFTPSRSPSHFLLPAEKERLEPWKMSEDIFYLSRHAIHVVPGYTKDTLVNTLIEHLRTMAGWTFEEDPEQGKLQGYYLDKAHEACVSINLYAKKDQLTIEVLALQGDREPAFALRAQLREKYTGKPSKVVSHVLPALPDAFIIPLLRERYLNELRSIYNLTLTDLSSQYEAARQITRLSINGSLSHIENPLFDDEASRTLIISSLEQLIQDHDASELVAFSAGRQALMACAELYKRPAYQAQILSSPRLLMCVYQHARLEETWQTAQIKQMCSDLFSKFTLKDKAGVLSALQSQDPTLVGRDMDLDARQASARIGFFSHGPTSEDYAAARRGQCAYDDLDATEYYDSEFTEEERAFNFHG